MYIEWDYENNQPAGSPSNLPGSGPDWIACQLPGRRASKGQALTWSLAQTTEGADLAVATWAGSADPLDAPATKAEILNTWLVLMEAPIQTSSGHWFQFDQVSERLMAGTLRALATTGGQVEWRLADNTELAVSYEQLRDYMEELLDARAMRGLVLNEDYLTFKHGGCTRSELAAWEATYALPE